MPKVRKYLLERREREARKRLATDRVRLERLVSEDREAEEITAPGEGVHLEEKAALLTRENEQLRAEIAEEKIALLTRENEQLRAELARLRAQSCPTPIRARTNRQLHGGLERGPQIGRGGREMLVTR